MVANLDHPSAMNVLAALCLPTVLALYLSHTAPKKAAADDHPKSFDVKVLRQIPHVKAPFTQGLEFREEANELVETSGSYPVGVASYVRGVNLDTGATNWLSTEGLDDSFIEGITKGPKGHWFASVYQQPRKTLEYDSNMKFIKTRPYHFDGWGFTRSLDGTSFLATNGSSTVMSLDPENFELVGSKVATCLGRPVPALNELEMIPNFLGKGPALLGNVYTSRVVLVLDPATMKCTGAFHLSGLAEAVTPGEAQGFHVANGVAYNPATESLFVTGKNWNSMFEVKVEESNSGGPSPNDASSLATAGHGEALDQLDKWLDSVHSAPGILP